MTAEFDPRHNARIIVLQKLFEKDFKLSNPQLAGNNSFNDLALQEASDLDAFDPELVMSLSDCLERNAMRIDSIIEELAPEWPISQISKIDLMILRLAIAEGFILKITPQKVVINEAIELAKEFSNDQTRKFVSGVLGNLYTNQLEILK
jgi:N utilization substance protein B